MRSRKHKFTSGEVQEFTELEDTKIGKTGF